MRAIKAGVLCLAALATTAAAAKAGEETVSYRLTPEFQAGALAALDVEVRLRADRSGETVFDLPDPGISRSSRWRFISDVTAQGASMREDGPAKRVLTSAPGAEITLRYRVHSAYDSEPQADEGRPDEGAVILPAWFAALGEFVFVWPEGRNYAPATFHWGAAPSGWVVASDLDEVAPEAPLTVSDVMNSTMLGGADVKLFRRPIQGGQLRVAIRGDWALPEARLVDDISSVIDAQRRFWDKESGPFFVDVVPLEPSPHSAFVGGRGEFDGFALYGTGNADESMMRRTLAHEHTHNWIPFQQGRMPEGGQALSVYWYSEGFTDFYADRTLLRSGIWSLADFVQHLNEVLRAYDTSPVRTAPNSRIVSDSWTDEDVEKLPYERGYLLAFLWDRQMRLASHGRTDLDQVMFAMRDRYDAAAADAKPELIANLERTALDVAGLDIGPDLDRITIHGEPISLPPDLFEGCATIATVARPVFDLGFDLAATRERGAFVGVDPAGPAYRAGVREGMKWLGMAGGAPADSSVKIQLLALDRDGTERDIRYKPAGSKTISFQQVELTSRGGTDAAGCTALMSGQLQSAR